MDACGCDPGFEIFDESTASADLERYRRHGPDTTTRMLLDMIKEHRVNGASVLDIGGGVGVIDHELLHAGAGRAVLVDASPPALQAARDEARRRASLDRIEFVDGDFVAEAASIDHADVVTLDRVVCCYPNVDALVRLSAQRARSVYGLVLPRDRWFFRLGTRLLNAWYRVRGLGYRAFAHPNERVDELAAEAGLQPRREAHTFVWRVVLYERESLPA